MKYEKKHNFNASVKSAFFHYVAVLTELFFALWLIFILGNLYVVVHSNVRTNATLKAFFSKEIANYMLFFESAASAASFQAYARYESDEVELYKILYDFNRGRQCKCLFYVLNRDADILVTNAWQAGENYAAHNAMHKQFLQSVDASDEPVGYTSHEKRIGGNDIVYIFGKKIVFDVHSLFIVFELQEAPVLSAFSGYDSHIVILKDGYDTVLAANHHGIKDSWNRFTYNASFIPSIISVNKTDYLIAQSALSGTDITLVTLTPVTMLERIILYGILVIVLFSILILAMMNMLASSVAERLSKPVIQLKNAIAEFQAGNFDYTLRLENNDEFQYLSNQYMELVKEIKALIDQNMEISNQTRLAEIRLLQAQFDPHFLFNILQTVYCTNYENPSKSNQIIDLLASLLHYSLGGKEMQVEMQQDLQYIKTYLELQKIRLEDKLQYSIYISEELNTCMIPKLLLQPLVENCIRYSCHKETLSIAISGTAVDGIVVLHVKDDGDGISDKDLRKLHEKLNCERVPASEHLGLLNTHYRLRLMYGAPYGITIKSTSTEGTDIRLDFPFRR